MQKCFVMRETSGFFYNDIPPKQTGLKKITSDASGVRSMQMTMVLIQIAMDVV